jgi:undecaprenyl-phosphate galactose phosphotransferase
MKKHILKIFFVLIDILVLIGVLYLSICIRGNFSGIDIPGFYFMLLQNFVFVIFIILLFFYYEKIYSLNYDFWQETHEIYKALFFSYILTFALFTFSKTDAGYSKVFITLYFSLLIIFMPIAKRISKKIFFSFPFFRTKVLIIGEKKEKEILKREFLENWYLGTQSVLKNYDAVIIISKNFSSEKLHILASKYLMKRCVLYIVPYVTKINFANSTILEYTNIRSNTLHVENKLLVVRNIVLKSIFDKISVICLLPFFVFVHGIISIAIKLDSKGSIFFKQARMGRDDGRFLCYKYRTMYEDSAEVLQKYLMKNPSEKEYYEKFHKYQNDPRITKIGSFLRATSLDEFPQILNVLKGDMSLVGPRPYMPSEAQKIGNSLEQILKVKPGITGLWQVSGRSNVSFEKRNELDEWYIRNWSLWLDFIIVIKTIKVVLGKVGAK